MSRFSQYRLLYILAGIVIAFDQLTKWLVERSLSLNSFYPETSDAIEIIPGFFNIVHLGNKGAAWSIGADWPLASYLLPLVAVVALLLLYFFRRQLELHLRYAQIAFGLITGGIIGNLYDRIFRGDGFFDGHVVDFLDFNFGGWHFPSFNVADSGITVGAVLYVLASFRSPAKKD